MRVFVLAVLSVLVEFCHGEWACEENNGWLHYVDDDGKAVCRVDSFRANCDGEFPAAFLLNIYHDPTCPCVQIYPLYMRASSPTASLRKERKKKKR